MTTTQTLTYRPARQGTPGAPIKPLKARKDSLSAGLKAALEANRLRRHVEGDRRAATHVVAYVVLASDPFGPIRKVATYTLAGASERVALDRKGPQARSAQLPGVLAIYDPETDELLAFPQDVGGSYDIEDGGGEWVVMDTVEELARLNAALGTSFSMDRFPGR